MLERSDTTDVAVEPEPVRVGVIGGGNMAAVHVRSLLGISSARLVALGAPEVRPDVARAVEEAGGKVTDAGSILDQDDLDAVVIATPNATHASFILPALESGLGVFCEKPLTIDIDEGKSVLAAVHRTNAKLAVGHVVRYFPAYQAIRREIMAGTIGIPGVARMRRAGGAPRGWFADPAQSGGALFDLAIHNIDWALWTFGEVRRVTALVAGPAERATVMITLAHASGPLALIEAGWDHPTGFLTGLEVSGSEGLLRTGGPPTPSFSFTPRDKSRPPVLAATTDPHSPYRQELEEALGWFRGGPAPRATAVDAFAAVEVAAAALRSSQTGQPVSLATAGNGALS